MKNALQIFFVITFIILLSSASYGQMAVADYNTATNDRFANSSSFFLNNQDFSGVGRDSSGRWATLVSKNVFLSASHYHPATGGTLTFHHSNDPLGATTTRLIAGGYKIANSDIWIGWLDSSVGPAVTHYDIPIQSAGDTVGKVVATVGQSQGGNKSGVARTNFVVGQNRVDAHGNVTTSGINNDVIQWVEDEAGDKDALGSNYKVAYESKVNTGDSGAPSFVVNGPGDMELVGLHFSVTSTLKDGKIRPASRDTNLPNYRAIITQEINNQALKAVPEPGSSALLALSALLIWIKRR